MRNLPYARILVGDDETGMTGSWREDEAHARLKLTPGWISRPTARAHAAISP